MLPEMDHFMRQRSQYRHGMPSTILADPDYRRAAFNPEVGQYLRVTNNMEFHGIGRR